MATIKKWEQVIKTMDTNTIREMYSSLNNLNKWVFFSDEFKGVGTRTVELLLKDELVNRGVTLIENQKLQFQKQGVM